MSPYTQASFVVPTTHIKSRSYSKLIFCNTSLLNILSFILLVLLALTYMVVVNAGASKGYRIRNLENQINELTLSNQQMELISRKTQSLETVSHAVKMLGLVPEMHPVYIDAGHPSYAFAK